MTRRAQNEGSIRRRADGRWEARVHVGYANGKRQRKSFYGATRREVQAQLVTALRNLQSGQRPSDDRLTVRMFCDHWLQAVRPSLRPSTYARYEQIVRLHVIPDLGRQTLARLDPIEVQALLNEKLKSGMAPQGVSHVRAVLRTFLADAVKWGKTTRNVAALTDPPRVPKRRVDAMSPDVARRLLEAFVGQPEEALVALAIGTGLRQGELLGLQWLGVDFDKGTVNVHQAMQRVAGKATLVEPKSESSHRTVAVPERLLEILRGHRTRQLQSRLVAGSSWTDLDLVFCSPVGAALHASRVTRTFQARLREQELPRMRFHDLRHGCASLLLALGISPRVVMEMLGHSTIALTMNTYSHVIPSLTRDAADQLNQMLAGAERR